MRRDDAYLLDMLLSARDAARFMAGLTFADFERDRRTQKRIVSTVGLPSASGVRPLFS